VSIGIPVPIVVEEEDDPGEKAKLIWGDSLAPGRLINVADKKVICLSS
jgi:hypothetical protein